MDCRTGGLLDCWTALAEVLVIISLAKVLVIISLAKHLLIHCCPHGLDKWFYLGY